jgi:hypothetical protein
MYCKNCGAQLQPGNPTCLTCGANVGDGNAYCSNCGNAINPGAIACTNCGFAVNAQAPAQNTTYLNGQDKTVMILLSILLGGLGIHNFMMGEAKKGIFRIVMSFVCGIGWIFSIIDCIKIASGSYVVEPDKLV